MTNPRKNSGGMDFQIVEKCPRRAKLPAAPQRNALGASSVDERAVPLWARVNCVWAESFKGEAMDERWQREGSSKREDTMSC